MTPNIKTGWVAGMGAAVFGITLALFLQTVHFDFVNLDDVGYVPGNPHMAGGLTFGNIGWSLLSISYAACWMPLTWLSYMTDVSLFGGSPGALHAVNIVYHACNAALLFLLLRAVLGRGERAALSLLACAAGALFWALHPLRVEPVAWIASRKDVLSLFWELLALLCWVRAVRGGRAEDGGRRTEVGGRRAEDGGAGKSAWVRAAFVCFVLALLAKPTAMTFPILAGLLEFLLTRRVVLRRLSDFFYAALMGGLISAVAQRAGGATQQLAGVPLYGRVLNAIAAIGVYARDTVWPVNLAVPYPHAWPALPLFFWPALGICVALGASLAWAVWREREDGGRRTEGGERRTESSGGTVWAVGLLWVLIAVAPMLGLANFGYHSHADRFTYLPAIGLSLILTGGLLGVTRRSLAAGGACGLALLLALVLLARQSVRQTAFWKDGGALCTHTLQVTGPNVNAHRILGIYFFSMHRNLQGAIDHLRRSIELGGAEVPFCHHSMFVMTLAEAGQFEEAERHVRRMNELPEGLPKEKTVCSLLAYGAIALYKGELATARQHLARVLEIAPELSDAHYLLGKLALKEGRRDEAIREWRLALDNDKIRFGFLKEEMGK